MKKNTAMILLSSFVPSGFPQERGLRRYQFYYDLFSDMTEGGVRATIYQLVEKRYLKRLSLNGQSFFRITDAGIGKLTLLHPSLRIKERKKGDMRGHLLLLLQPTASDPHFLKLHKELTAEMFSQVSRGVYFYPFPLFPERLMSIILEKYSSSVSIAVVKEFSLAFPDRVGITLQQKKELEIAISGVSSEMQKLINIKQVDNRSFYQSKTVITKFFALLVQCFDQKYLSFWDQKQSRDLIFQALEAWNELIDLFYFSQRK